MLKNCLTLKMKTKIGFWPKKIGLDNSDKISTAVATVIVTVSNIASFYKKPNNRLSIYLNMKAFVLYLSLRKKTEPKSTHGAIIKR